MLPPVTLVLRILFVCTRCALVDVLLIALTDVIFAVDSIPAIFAITSDPFIVLTSNVFAILGLRPCRNTWSCDWAGKMIGTEASNADWSCKLPVAAL